MGVSSRDVAAYCMVTVVHDGRRLDTALPTGIPIAELLPGLLRVAVPDAGSDETGVWELARIGPPVLVPGETLAEAGVLDGELLMLHRKRSPPATGPANASVRDQLEDVVQRIDESWTTSCWTAFLLWSAAVLGLLLLIPASQLDGATAAATAAAVACGLVASALLAARGRRNVTAATCLWIGCGWAGLAGWFLAPAGSGPIGAAVAALLLASSAVRWWSGALTQCAAMVVVLPATGVVLLATGASCPPGQALLVAAVSAVLLLGLAPRIVLALTGLSSTHRGADDTPVESRFLRADSLLTGALIGLSAVVVTGGTMLAASFAPLDQAVAAAIGAALLLRSRVYSRVPHLLPTRVGGALLLAAVGAGLYLRDPGLRPLLIVLPMVGLALAAAVVALVGESITTVGRARLSRCLDVLDKLVVIGVIVGSVGILGLFSWMATLLE